jgi:hypothetical protein
MLFSKGVMGMVVGYHPDLFTVEVLNDLAVDSIGGVTD